MSALRRDLTVHAHTEGFGTRGHVPVRDLEVGELRAFCAAATLGSIAEAARAMNVSQPAMSKRLRSLETVAGTELFEAPGPFMPVRIASSPTIAELRLPSVLSDLASREQGLTAELISANSGL